MISREYIYSVIKDNHVIAVHMKGEDRIDGQSELIYIIHDLLLDEKEEQLLVWNLINKKDTHGVLKIKAMRSSEADTALEDNKLREYVINTEYILSYELMKKGQ